MKKVIKNLFLGGYSYGIQYKIPLLKKHVVISDTSQTYYTGTNRIGNEKKIVKINDKSVKDYTKQEIQTQQGNVLLLVLKKMIEI